MNTNILKIDEAAQTGPNKVKAICYGMKFYGKEVEILESVGQTWKAKYEETVFEVLKVDLEIIDKKISEKPCNAKEVRIWVKGNGTWSIQINGYRINGGYGLLLETSGLKTFSAAVEDLSNWSKGIVIV